MCGDWPMRCSFQVRLEFSLSEHNTEFSHTHPFYEPMEELRGKTFKNTFLSRDVFLNDSFTFFSFLPPMPTSISLAPPFSTFHVGYFNLFFSYPLLRAISSFVSASLFVYISWSLTRCASVNAER